MRRWWALPVVVAVLGVGLTAFAASVAATRTRAARRAALDHAADQLGFAVTERVRLPAEALHTLGAVIAHAPAVDHATFDAVAAAVHRRMPRVYALEWAPRVPAAARAEVEARARAEVRRDWVIREPAATGLAIAAARGEYVPILYAYPDNPAWGFDVLSRAEAAAVYHQACAAGTAVFSPRYRLVEDADDVASVILYQPVWRGDAVPADPGARCAAAAGVAILIFRVAAVVGEAIDRSGYAGLEVALDDVTGGTAELLYEQRPGAARRLAGATRGEVELELHGRTWRLRVGHVAAAPWPAAPLAIGGGLTLLATAVAASAAWVLAQRRRLHELTRLGQYRVEREIGRGAMGVVYRAHHTLLHRPAALKLLAPDLVDAASRARFEREVQLAARLQHPGIVAVYDFGVTAEGLFFYAMELLEGVSLRELVAEHGPLPPARAVAITRQIAEALAEAHGKRIVHRDLAPSNLMLTIRGESYDVVKVLDFGLARRVRSLPGDDDSDTPSVEPGIITGTPGYVAPEVLRGHDADERVDLYALGAVLYLLLAGRPAFSAPTVEQTMRAQLRAAPAPLHRLVPELPAALVELVIDCMQPDPRLRIRSMRELLQRLDALPVPPWSQDQARRWWKDHLHKAGTP